VARFQRADADRNVRPQRAGQAARQGRRARVAFGEKDVTRRSRAEDASTTPLAAERLMIGWARKRARACNAPPPEARKHRHPLKWLVNLVGDDRLGMLATRFA
jgi:hypothetical protein